MGRGIGRPGGRSTGLWGPLNATRRRPAATVDPIGARICTFLHIRPHMHHRISGVGLPWCGGEHHVGKPCLLRGASARPHVMATALLRCCNVHRRQLLQGFWSPPTWLSCRSCIVDAWRCRRSGVAGPHLPRMDEVGWLWRIRHPAILSTPLCRHGQRGRPGVHTSASSEGHPGVPWCRRGGYGPPGCSLGVANGVMTSDSCPDPVCYTYSERCPAVA